MDQAAEQLGHYLHLAQASERRRQPLVRDRLLVLCGVLAADMGLPSIAACCRQRILKHNPAHLISRFEDFATALEDAEFLTLLRQLARRYPQEKVETMLSVLGIDAAGEQDAYFTSEEYAAAILGYSLTELKAEFG